MGRGLGTIAILAALAGGQAQATCWTPSEVAAAKVRDLDTMLMVSALRCRFEAPDIVAKYNAAVQHQRGALDEMNGRIRKHFSAPSANAAAAAYDTYVTHVANRFGAGAGGLSCAAFASIAEAAAAEEPNADALLSLAERAEMTPDLGEGACAMAAPPAVVIAATVAPVAPAPLVQAVAVAAVSLVAPATMAVAVAMDTTASAPAVTLAGLQK